MKSCLLVLALLLPVMAAGQSLPDAPQPQPEPQHVYARTWENIHGKSANFLTFRSKWQDPPLRSNKQVFKSPLFLLPQAGMVASMVVACRNPRSQEDWHSEVPAVGGVLALDYLSYRFFSGPHSLGPALYAIIHYSRAATK